HELSTMMQTISMHDIIEISSEKNPLFENIIEITCNNPEIPCGEANLCFKAAKIFLDYFKISNKKIIINIEKNIPQAAGLGGGSSDAAEVIKGLNQLLNINSEEKYLNELGVKIGADIPFFFKGGLQLAEGIGEILTPQINELKYWVVITKPKLSALSGDIYKIYDKINNANEIKNKPTTQSFLKALKGKSDITAHVGNMLSEATESACDDIKIFRDEMINFGAKAASMSGSGSAVFGLFDDYSNGVVAMNILKQKAELSEIYELSYPKK
ncbi:MAG: 4-diphosphocytidyl-2C-methyl-D-erythritol kinase, partial [Clostridia bacterium]|nr:4-diphosphocytidyl-2C-methyl-D-erythritol kinase [Clostridia bacterium]